MVPSTLAVLEQNFYSAHTYNRAQITITRTLRRRLHNGCYTLAVVGWSACITVCHLTVNSSI